jgi:HEAT repeat protein
MPKVDKQALPAEVEAALTALATYDNGSQRATLLSLDSATVKALESGPERRLLEEKLTHLLKGAAAASARQYICGRLALIGTAHSVPFLAALLADPAVATDARTALEAMPDEAASRALVHALKDLEGLERAGAIRSLGVRHYKPAIPLLQREQQNPDKAVRKAAEDALDRILVRQTAAAAPITRS